MRDVHHPLRGRTDGLVRESTPRLVDATRHVFMTTLASEQFGEHHWALLALIEQSCYEQGQSRVLLPARLLRINPSSHPTHALALHRPWHPEHGTRLAGFRRPSSTFDIEQALKRGLLLSGHDDIDCLSDLAGASYISFVTDNWRYVMLTLEGARAAARHRQFVIAGNRSCLFTDTPPEA